MQEEAGHERVGGWKLAAITKEDAKAAEKLWMELAKERAHLDEECPADEVVREAAWCQEAIGNVLGGMPKMIKICVKSKWWWKADIMERRKAVGKENRRRQNLDEAGKAQAEFHKSIHQSKRKMYSEYMQNRRGAAVWRAAQGANPWAGMTVDSLTYTEGKQANTSLENREMLKRKSFPPNDDEMYYELLRAGTAHPPVAETEVERDRFSKSVTKAPGPVKPSFGAIRLLCKWDNERIVSLTKAAIRTRRHALVLKRASAVVIHMPCKDDYMQLNTYCSILLLSCMGKVVEKVVAELLPDWAERRGLLSDGQLGSGRGWAAIDVAANIVERAHAACRDGHIPGVLRMDIKAAFPSTAQIRLVNLMKVSQMDGHLIRWTASIVSERMAEIVIEGNAME